MEEKKLKVFLIVTSFLSTIILLMGATFSYFSLNNKSDDNALAVSALDIRINLGLSELYTGHYLIPLKDELINKAYERECVDDLGRGACLAYTLELFNYSDEHEMVGTIDFAITGIKNLSYMVLDEHNNTYLDVTHIDSSSSTNLSLGDNFILQDGNVEATRKKFILLIWLTDTNDIQNESDSLGYFNATVTFTSVDGAKLSGSVQGIKSSTVETSIID